MSSTSCACCHSRPVAALVVAAAAASVMTGYVLLCTHCGTLCTLLLLLLPLLTLHLESPPDCHPQQPTTCVQSTVPTMKHPNDRYVLIAAQCVVEQHSLLTGKVATNTTEHPAAIAAVLLTPVA
jgi:hypothetical protein